MPSPAGGATEGETGYACENDGDCHLIVVDSAQCRLYEMWRANRTSASAFQGGCLAVWNLSAPYSPTLRGDCCTSADAAGLPIAAHMFTADEIAGGEIPHAIRFILPNKHMRSHIYVRPATHSTGATTGPATAPPYGARMRLKASFNDSSLKPAARVVTTALKRYGMILSDGGNLTFTAANDRFTTAKWADVDLGPGDLTSLKWSDFEVPELGMRYTWDNACDCKRTPISQ
jgi:serine/threonine-protein kinase